MIRLAAMTLAAALLCGCAHYEFDILDPPDLRQHIGKAHETTFRTDAVQYRMRAVGGSLVIHLENHQDEPITLVAPQSTVIAQSGESHPIQPQTIEPGSYVELFFPPPPQAYQREGGSFYFGAGFHSGYYTGPSHYYADRGDRYRHHYYRHYRGPYVYAPFYSPWYYDYPRTYLVYDANNPLYWDWPGEGTITVKFVFDQGGKTIQDRMVIKRTRVKE